MRRLTARLKADVRGSHTVTDNCQNIVDRFYCHDIVDSKP